MEALKGLRILDLSQIPPGERAKAVRESAGPPPRLVLRGAVVVGTIAIVS